MRRPGGGRRAPSGVAASRATTQSQGSIVTSQEVKLLNIARSAISAHLMGVAIMLLPPERARLNIVQACDVCAPRHLDRHLAKLGVLLHHGRDDTEEGFVRGEEAGATRKRIPLKQALKS